MEDTTVIAYMYYVCDKMKISSARLFRVAYKWHYGVDGDTRQDFAVYLKTKKLPYYVTQYLDHIRDSKVRL